jgi:DNA-directed RNA polymerase subunit beta'
VNNRMLERFREYINVAQFNALRVKIASPEKIRSLSYGEVKKIETINYRTLKPERDGLFCARIFGPVKDWECNCGKYKRMKHRGITCEKCGVEVIQSRVRRERMGHIELNASVCHIWYLKGIPSYLSLILDMPVKDLERVIYFDVYMVVRQGNSPYAPKTLLSGVEVTDYMDAHPDDVDFLAESGAQAVKSVLRNIDLAIEIAVLEKNRIKTASVAVRHKLMRRTKVLTSLVQANVKPEWMILDVLPVLPPDLRPLVPLEGGRFASSDLNELYRRVLNRNIRLQRLKEIDAPSVIIKNEQRMLQEAVDALIDNGRRGQPVRGSNRRPFKSLSEMLRGKQGRFRQNLLGRRVDYSGRSVIVVDPELRMHQCGLPKIMALELFKSYVLAGLLEREIAANLRIAKKMVEEHEPEVWDVLEDVVKDKVVLLNRAPTLHRLGIQAFYPILVDGKAIKIHPLVCGAFNADFDGDQMAVHVPLSQRAQQESKQLILSTRNIMSSQNGRPNAVPSQDMVLGLYYLTKIRNNLLGEGTVFSNTKEVIAAYQHSQVALHAKVSVRMGDKVVETTTGRIILLEALPSGIDFTWINKVMKNSDIGKLVEAIYSRFGHDVTVESLDKIKKLGFYHASIAGVSLSIRDLIVPEQKEKIVQKAEKSVEKIESLYRDAVITNGERYNKVISIWGHATADIANAMTKNLEQQNDEAFVNADGTCKPFNPIFMMLDSGSRGSKDQIKQLVGMRGLMSTPTGEIMETPVKNNFKDGLSVFEYFISTHGARKGQADTALKTANSGYLTRRLVDVAQDAIITMHDCQTLGYVELEDLAESGDVLYSMAGRAFGRVLAADVKDPVSGNIILRQGDMVDRAAVAKLNDSAVSKVLVRSVLTCQAKRGVCALCYGFDLSRSELVDVGAAVGVIAAQSIGEPGTQLTMRTFHVGGTASGMADQPYCVARASGIVEWQGVRVVKNHNGQDVVMSRKARIVIKSADGREFQRNNIEYGSVISAADGSTVEQGAKLAEWDSHNKVLLTERSGFVKYVDLAENITLQESFDEVTNKVSYSVLEQKEEKWQPALSIVDASGAELAHYYLPTGSYIAVTDGQEVTSGDVLVKTPRELSRTKDITTGGLPRIAELFEARTPKDPAILADIDGDVIFGGIVRGMRKLSVISGSESYDYLVPRGKQLNVVDGERVNAGDQLTSGSPVLHDMLRILGPDVVQKYLVDHIQEIYRLQGIDINDRHIELIAKQMMRKVRVIDQGDTDFLIGDRVDRVHFQNVNASLQKEGKRPAIARPVLMGITTASLGTESFFSAASFQETTRILAEAAISGQVDYLYGLKENVIVGKLIPAGTGITSFRKRYLGEDVSDIEREARRQEMLEAAQRREALAEDERAEDDGDDEE